MSTQLRYMEDMARVNDAASVIRIDDTEGKTAIILDQTIFYPQGGGQPYDQGSIGNDTASFRVEEVRYRDGEVYHYGTLERGTLDKGDAVQCNVDPERRLHHARLHSGGHIIDMIVAVQHLPWTPTKGYHFPDGPYVEYSGADSATAFDALKEIFQKEAERITSTSLETHIEFMTKEAMQKACRFVSDAIPVDKPGRVVWYGDFGVPCGGTHVANLTMVAPLIIRDIKMKKGIVRVSYQVG